MILIYKTKPEYIQQIMFSGFGKYEQTNKLQGIEKTGNKLIKNGKNNILGYN